MRSARALTLYLLAVFLGAALLAPWVYWAAQALAPHGALFKSIAAQPFHRYVNRCLIGIALIGLWPFLRAMGVREWRSLGLVSPRGQGRPFAFGFALGFLSLFLVAIAGLVSGARAFAPNLDLQHLLKSVGTAAATAAVVSVLEEVLFRGVLFGRLRVSVGDTLALLASAGLYSIVHFFQRPAPPASVHVWSGLETLGQMLHGFVDFHALMPGFLTLLLAGAILAGLFRTTGTLYASIGLHAGWIFWLKLYGTVTRDASGDAVWIWGTSKLIDGWSALVGMCLCALLAWRFGRKARA